MADHNTILQWFEGLVPTINQTLDPKTVLTKFANSKNLAPAQLEKLGHIYNAAKSLSFMNNNMSKRYESFPVLDITNMVQSYSAPELEKIASSSTEVSEIQHVDSFADVFLDNDSIKSAAIDTSINELFYQVNLIKQAYKDEDIAKINKTNAEQYAFEQDQAMQKDLKTIAYRFKQGFSSLDNFVEVHKDLWAEKGEALNKIAHSIAQHLSNVYNVHVKLATEKSNRLITDTKDKELKALTLSVYDKHEQIKAANAVAKEFSDKPSQKKPTDKTDDSKEKTDDAKENTDDSKKPTDKTDDSNKNTDKIIDSIIKTPEERVKSSYFVDEKKSDKPKKKKVTSPLTAPSDFINYVKDNTQDWLPTSNRHQQQFDSSLQKERHQILLDSLLHNDPVLSTLNDDEKEIVTDVYNSIKDVAPTLAMDKAAIRPWLRQANEFGGISPNELASLLDLETKLQSLKLNQNKLNTENYSL